jgi:hypothetical protein
MHCQCAHLLVGLLDEGQCSCCLMLCDVVVDVLPVATAHLDVLQLAAGLPGVHYASQALVEDSQLQQLVLLPLGCGPHADPGGTVKPAVYLKHLPEVPAKPTQAGIGINFADKIRGGLRVLGGLRCTRHMLPATERPTAAAFAAHSGALAALQRKCHGARRLSGRTGGPTSTGGLRHSQQCMEGCSEHLRSVCARVRCCQRPRNSTVPQNSFRGVLDNKEGPGGRLRQAWRTSGYVPGDVPHGTQRITPILSECLRGECPQIDSR